MDEWKEAIEMEIKRLEQLKADLVNLTSKISPHLDSHDKHLFSQLYAQIETEILRKQMDLEIDNILSKK